VLTQRYDNQRTGANVLEAQLTPSAVASGKFGLLFSRSVIGQIYGQPLYVPALAMPGGATHDVVFVVTQHDDVYAFDANDPKASAPLWHVSLGAPVPDTETPDQGGIVPDVGITSTPVIDLTAQTMYVLALTKEPGTGAQVQRLHALSLLDGTERAGSPVIIAATAPGTPIEGGASDPNVDGGVVTFDPYTALQRVALALVGNVLYVAQGSHGDGGGVYHGWVLAYDATTLALRAAHVVTPYGQGAGIWQAGQGLAIDEHGDVYYVSGNGTFDDSSPDALELGDSIVKLHFDGASLGVTDYFTPSNQDALNTADLDLGSAGALLVPTTNLVLGGGKEGKLYVLDRDDMGKFAPVDRAQQIFQAANGILHGTPVYWYGADGPRIYVGASPDFIYGYRFDGSRFADQAFTLSPTMIYDSILSVSSNGTSHGIVWANTASVSNDDGALIVPGTLRAFDATDLSQELWNSDKKPSDALGLYAKFCPPMIADGKVFVATFSGALQVYGLRQ
jgi:hypothetical protein